MKTIMRFSIIVLLVGLTSCYTERRMVSAQGSSQISFQTFYDELSPYGQWIEDYNYGYMWIPHVNRNFQPYASDGYWTMTNYGNTWVSNYSWGWAPFHYGRWLYDDFLGWAGIPGYEWAPAWVSWRSGGGYYGWAPLGPRMRVNVNINIPWSHWTFLPQRHMYGRSMHSYYNRGNRNFYQQTTIINNTNIYNNNTYYSGPSARDVERSTGRKVSVRNVTNSGRAGRTSVSNRSVNVYRPEVVRNTERSARPASTSNRTSVSGSTTNSGRTSTTRNRESNVNRSTNSSTPQSTRNNTSENSTNRTRRESNSTNSRGAVNSKSETGTTNRTTTTNRQNNNREANKTVNRSSSNQTRQPASTESSSTRANTRSSSASQSRSTSRQSSGRSSNSSSSRSNRSSDNDSSRSTSSSRSGRSR